MYGKALNPHTITLDEATFARLQNGATARGQNVNQFATALIAEGIAREAARERGFIEGRALLESPARPIDEAFTALRRKHNLPDRSHLTREELAAEADRIIEAMDPAKRAELAQQSIL